MKKKQTNVALVTVAIFVATFMSAIEGTIVSTAMPTIVGDLHGVNLMNWVISIFLLTNAIFTPIYGKLSDIFGRKRVFIIGIIIFLIGSMLSGLAHSMTTLIIWRALQGNWGRFNYASFQHDYRGYLFFGKAREGNGT